MSKCNTKNDVQPLAYDDVREHTDLGSHTRSPPPKPIVVHCANVLLPLSRGTSGAGGERSEGIPPRDVVEISGPVLYLVHQKGYSIF